MPKNRVSLFIAVAAGCLSLVGFSGSASGLAGSAARKQPQVANQQKEAIHIKQLRRLIDLRRQTTWQWQDTALASRTPSHFNERRTIGVQYLRWLHNLWERRSARARETTLNPPHLSLWLCIQSGVLGGKWDGLVHLRGGTKVSYGEASWFDNGSPYWGGLQMGQWFHSNYGGPLYRRYGTANNWRPIQQIWVAERAYAREGYSKRWLSRQWPNTAPPCASEA